MDSLSFIFLTFDPSHAGIHFSTKNKHNVSYIIHFFVNNSVTLDKIKNIHLVRIKTQKMFWFYDMITLYNPDEVDVNGLLITLKELGHDTHIKRREILVLTFFVIHRVLFFDIKNNK